MSQEQAPAGGERFLLRRIHKSRCTKTEPVEALRAGFCPTDEDTDGLSVFFEDQTSAAEVLAAARKPAECFVFRVPLRAVLGLNLTVVPDELPKGPRGHALIPELNVSAYRAEKERTKRPAAARWRENARRRPYSTAGWGTETSFSGRSDFVPGLKGVGGPRHPRRSPITPVLDMQEYPSSGRSFGQERASGQPSDRGTVTP
jgi:hypothetical protein